MTRRRVWTTVATAPAEGGVAVLLDDRPLRTQGGAAFVAPAPLAEAAAAEWDAVGETIDPLAMPATRAVNTAIDIVRPGHARVVDLVAAYGGTDLVCYRAASPASLVARQAAAWDPLMDWAARRYGARLIAAEGVMYAAQPRQAEAALAAEVARADEFALTALHDLVTLSGSLVIGLAVAEGRLGPAEGWAVSRVDEDYQIEQWGEDAEAAAFAERKRRDFHNAAWIWELATR